MISKYSITRCKTEKFRVATPLAFFC